MFLSLIILQTEEQTLTATETATQTKIYTQQVTDTATSVSTMTGMLSVISLAFTLGPSSLALFAFSLIRILTFSDRLCNSNRRDDHRETDYLYQRLGFN